MRDTSWCYNNAQTWRGVLNRTKRLVDKINLKIFAPGIKFNAA